MSRWTLMCLMILTGFLAASCVRQEQSRLTVTRTPIKAGMENEYFVAQDSNRIELKAGVEVVRQGSIFLFGKDDVPKYDANNVPAIIAFVCMCCEDCTGDCLWLQEEDKCAGDCSDGCAFEMLVFVYD